MPQPITTSSNYGMSYSDPPDLKLTTDSEGVISIPRASFPSHISANVDRSNGTAVVSVNDRGTQRWAYIESLDLNMAYWRGNHDSADITITADAPLCFDQLGPSSIDPEPEALVTTAEVTFHFPNTPGHHYDVVYTIDGGEPITVSLTPLPSRKDTTMTAVLTLPRGRIVWWIIDHDVPATCPVAQSSIYSFDHAAGFALTRHRSVHH